MAAVGAIQQIQIPLQAVAVDVRPQDQRVVEASKGIFERAKETAVRIWHATVTAIQVAGDKISFVVFRVLEWVHPALGPKIENVWLRVSNIWEAIKQGWKEEETRKQIENLQVQNHELQVKTRDYDEIVFQNRQLTGERDRLQQDHQALFLAKNFAEEALRIAREQAHNIIGREQEVVQYRDIVVLKNQQLEQANQQLEQANQELVREKNEATQALARFLAENRNLLQQLAAAQQELLDVQQLLPNQREMNEKFALVADAVQRVPQLGQTELNDLLEELLPLLRGQMAQANARLDTLTQPRQNPLNPDEMLPPLVEPFSPTAIVLGSFRRIMQTIDEHIARIPNAMRLHGQFQHPVHQLLWNLQQQQPMAV